MTLYAVDSTNIYDDPIGAAVVLYYCDGIYAVSEAAVRARFPNALLVPVSAVGTNAGIVGDVEPGCMTTAQGIAWVLARRAAGHDPTIYCNEMNAWPGIRAAFAAAGVAQPHYLVADYDGIAAIPAGAIGKQYQNSTLTGGHFDRSVIADYWPGVSGVYGQSATSRTRPQLRKVVHLADSDSFIMFGIGDDDAIWYDRFDNAKGAWIGQTRIGGLFSDFDVTGSGQRIDIYGRGRDDRRAYHIYSGNAGETFTGPEALSGTFKSAIVGLGPARATAAVTPVDLSPVLSAVAAVKDVASKTLAKFA